MWKRRVPRAWKNASQWRWRSLPPAAFACAEARARVIGALYVDEVVGPRSGAPGLVVEAAIDLQGAAGTRAGVVFGLGLSQGGRDQQERSGDAAHQSGQMVAMSMRTLGS